jgi:hypothetical protein
MAHGYATGNSAGNRAIVVSGLSGNVTISFKLLTNMPSLPNSAYWFLFDGRYISGNSYLYGNGGSWFSPANASNFKINGVSKSFETYAKNAVAGDVISFQVNSASVGGGFVLFNRLNFNSEVFQNLTITDLTIVDNAGTHALQFPPTGNTVADPLGTLTVSVQNGTDSQWVFYDGGGDTQHQSTSGTATQAFNAAASTAALNAQHQITSGTATQQVTGTADTTANNSQLKATAGSAEQSATATADTSPLNGQHKITTGTAVQSAAATAESTATNSQHTTSAGSAGLVFSAQADTAPLNNQHRQSAGQLLSVAGFIADTSWVNTVDLGEVQHRSTSGSATQSATATTTTTALNSQHRQTSGTSAQAATGNAETAPSNKQHRQSAGQVLSVAGFIASTSWVNTVDLGNIQHRSTSGSSTQAATAVTTATAINSQNRQSAGRATAECTATAGTSRVNTILQKAVYIRRIESRSITKKIYHTASRHKIELKTQRGGGYMQELNFKQGASALLQIEHTIDGEPVTGISEAKYELYGRTGQVLVTKSMGEGIEFSAGLIEIQLTEDDTADLSQSYNHQCVAKDSAGLTFFPLNGQITFGATKPRL